MHPKNSLLPPPDPGSPDLLIIAGEHSGDQHAAVMVRDLLKENPSLRIAALGGPALAAAGARLLHDLTKSSVVGIAEVLRNLSYFRQLMDETVEWIAVHRPKVVCFVDYPGFNLRVAERLRKRGISCKGGGDVRTLYYIAPQVWAWKAKRRFTMARDLDALAVIFPFEVDVFSDTNLETSFVGHPFVDGEDPLPVNYDPDGPVLLLPGSRKQPVSRIYPLMLAAADRCPADWRFVTLYPSEFIRGILEHHLAKHPGLRGRVELRPASDPCPARAVLTSSGTMSLACSLAALPGAIVYKAHVFTYWLGRLLVKVDWLGIASIVLGETFYKEFIQGAAKPAALAKALVDAGNQAELERTQALSHQLMRSLMPGHGNRPAEWLLRHLDPAWPHKPIGDIPFPVK